jgi:5-methylcytosine-specific restriction endonuclease McrA
MSDATRSAPTLPALLDTASKRMNNKSRTIQKVCEALLAGDKEEASSIARAEYPFTGEPSVGRKYKETESTQIFIRDGFVDRYSGERLIFPGALRLLSTLLPKEFPFQTNWKMSECHMVYWELSPTIDHIIPVARGDLDNETNWATTSMLRNSAKSNWTLEELGWRLLPPGDFRVWDGLIGWLMEYIRREPLHLQDRYIKRWYNAAVRAVNAV